VKIRKLAAFSAVAGLALAACGSDSKDSSSSETTAAASATTSATTSADTTGGGEKATIRLWLNGEDTKQELVDYAVAEFKKQHPDVDVKFERQQWTGIVEKLTTALSSSDSPDLVELGNTQAQAFEAAGALQDLTDKKSDLGGDDLLQSLVEAGTYDNGFYGVPYYAGARIVVYRTDMLQQAGLAVPKTLDEFVQDGIKLKQANASTPNFSGIYFPGKYWYAALPFIWENGGDIAVDQDGKWAGKLADDGSVKGLNTVKEIMDKASGAPKDGDESKDYLSFCKNEIAMLMAPGWKIGQILNTDDGCPALKDKIGAFALPGSEAGSTSPAFLGGSNLAISKNSKHQDLAYDLLKIMVSKGYQEQFASAGTIPALKSLLGEVNGDAAAKAQAVAAGNSRFVPSSENWAGIEASTVLPDMLVAIAQGGDVKSEAGKANDTIVEMLNAKS
jgi:N,N'-diacetylchitobiose transport system substrate-binding protein